VGENGMKRLLPFLLVALALCSCASIQRARDQGNMDRLAALLSSGDWEELAKISSTPFLLDQEIILLEGDVRTFWSSIVQVGFKVQEPVLEEATRIGPESYREFRDSMEVRTFFKKYLKKNSRILQLRTSTGERILLLVTDSCCGSQINGFKGPF
jgi:hypothetical protein